MNPNTMTLDECRDWLAERKGWYKITTVVHSVDLENHRNSSIEEVQAWKRSICGDSDVQFEHPIPPTLDAIAACMPEGWSIQINIDVYEMRPFECVAWKDVGDDGIEASADSELLARARLAVACRMAGKEGK